MSNPNQPPDPFAFLGSTKVPKETVMSLESSDVNSSKPIQPQANPFDKIGLTKSSAALGFAPEKVPTTDKIGAFATGVKEGIVSPFTLLGAKTTPNPNIVEPSEKISEFLGSMVGLGINFAAFSSATGVVLKGIGLAGLASESPEVYGFVKNTLAGGAQFAGTSKTGAEVPHNAALGIAFGGAIEGMFLAKAIRVRAPALEPSPAAAEGLSSITQEIKPSELSKELSVAPSSGQSADRITSSLDNLFPQNKSVDETIVELSKVHETSAYIPSLGEGSEDLAAYAKDRLPDHAQVLVRPGNQGSKEIFIHNPLDPADVLNPKQVAQWQANGNFDGLEAIYNNKSYFHTGVPVAEGRVQLRDANGKTVFAPKIEDVAIPINPKVISLNGGVNDIRLENLRQAVENTNSQLGFVIPSATNENYAKRGVIDLSKYEIASSKEAFINKYKADIDKIQAPSRDEAISIMAQRKGISGLKIVDDGITTNVIPFDQSSVSYVKEVPKVGLTPDAAIAAVDVKTQQSQLLSLMPSWKNGIVGSLRSQGIPEKEINSYLDLQAAQVSKHLDEALDNEFKSMQNSSQAQFNSGCLE